MKRFGLWSLLAAMSLPMLPGVQSGLDARVKLITLPVRERVEIQLDHAFATLVEEERVVPLVAGTNQVEFSWANTSIDPGTIVFRVIGFEGDVKGASGGEVNVLSVSYPPGESALVWDVHSTHSGPVRVRISYLLGGLSKSYNYRAVAEHDESTLTLSRYIRVQNFANEQYDDTQIQAGLGDKFSKPIGLNETKEVLIEKTEGVPITKTYTVDLSQFGYLDPVQKKLRVPMHYVLTNDAKHKLGGEALPDGKVRIFQKDSSGTTAFTGEDWGQFTPIDDKMKLYLGTAQDVVVKRTIERRDRTKVGGNLSHFDVVVKYEIENFKDKPVTLDIAEQINNLRAEAGFNSDRPAEWVIGDQTTFKSKPDAEESSQDRVLFHADLPARKGDKAEKVVHLLHLTFRNQF
ncbi:MAG: hypothetical protein R3C45_17190 [Phycisphaerales bacterium]